ncbi:MAG TPA: aldehyde dehydrogenase family protein [Myxococcota bacterium]|jgi:glyceraldehyde-3-phosphate dehydrogenase (NADP+)|nr:aldehyde dehydrogenase family protein [Myxococcota bacterium]
MNDAGAPLPILIGGAWRPGGGGVAEVPDRFSGATFARVTQAAPSDVEDALAAAATAAPVLRAQARLDRRRLLAAVARGIEERGRELAETIVAEAGKPARFAFAEVERAVSTFALAADESLRLGGEVVPLDVAEPGRAFDEAVVVRFPAGPVAAITPFNFPLNLVAHKLAPALAAGCPVVLKPAPQTPVTALRLAEIILAAGAPPGALGVVPCGPAVAEALVRDARIRVLSFTGSAAVGWHLKDVAGHKRTLLELGGNAACIVHEDADLDWAAARCALGGFAYAGQVCIAVQRILVHAPVYDAFAARLCAEVDRLPIGDPRQPDTVMGPMIDEAAAVRVEAWVAEALAGGARALRGGPAAAPRRGALLPPIVLEGAPPDARVTAEEVFGPVVVLERYGALDEALAAVNRSRYGLQAAVFTHDVRHIQRAFRTLEVGAVVANDYPTFRVDNFPYGGVKDSGLGREGVRYAMEEMTEPRVLIVRR